MSRKGRNIKKKASDTKLESDIKKIKQMYENYGINTNDMSDRELNRLYKNYKKTKGNIDEDLKESKKFAKVFEEDII